MSHGREKPKRWGWSSFEFGGRYLATALASAEHSDYDGPVYNLEVEEDESYVTTGGTVHNCIWHRIDSIRSLDWKLVAADDSTGDVTDAITVGMAALKKPDRINDFDTWLAKWLYDVLAYDAGTLYRLRNRAGQPVGLAAVDGTTIAPLLDYWGNPPDSTRPTAYVQYVNGLPWNWLTRDDLIYEPYRPRERLAVRHGAARGRSSSTPTPTSGSSSTSCSGSPRATSRPRSRLPRTPGHRTRSSSSRSTGTAFMLGDQAAQAPDPVDAGRLQVRSGPTRRTSPTTSPSS